MTIRANAVPLTSAILFTSTLLVGCGAQQQKAEAPPPEPVQPEQRLIVHDLNTQTAGKRHLVAAEVDFTNDTGRELEYVMFKTRAFDQEGREIPSLKSGRPNAWLRIAGPLEPGSRTGAQRWEKVWASQDISCFRIEGAEVIYEDSSVEFYNMDQISVDLAVLPPAMCQTLDGSLASVD